MRIVLATAVMLLAVMTNTAGALEIDYEVVDNRPLFPKVLTVSLSGQFEAGDSEKLALILDETLDPDVRDISITLDSPGGSLIEGLLIARLLQEIPKNVSASVAGADGGPGLCASACVLAYLGADLRYMGDSTLIGVHQFSHVPGTMSDAEATDVAQRLSSEIVSLLQDQGVDMELFRRMSGTGPDDIDWVDRDTLELWGIVTGPVMNESMEFRNVNGSATLHIAQESLYGVNHMFLSCGNGLFALSSLQEPELAMLGDAAIVVDDIAYTVPDYDIVERIDGVRTRILFRVPPEAALAMRNAKTVGSRISVPGGDLFWGFKQRIRDSKVREAVDGCKSATAPVGSSDTAQPQLRFVEYPEADIPGGDLTRNGIRDISFAACKQLCARNRACTGVSYVQSKAWCWPKQAVGQMTRALGIISARYE